MAAKQEAAVKALGWRLDALRREIANEETSIARAFDEIAEREKALKTKQADRDAIEWAIGELRGKGQ